MTLLKTHVLPRETEAAEPGADPFAAQTETLRQQPAAFANIAREVRQACDRTEDAERELQRRRNRSGQ
jgi:hypothetical protein